MSVAEALKTRERRGHRHDPAETPVATPARVIVAMLLLDDTQVTWLVKSLVELSE